jgi:hypothetical protein
MNVPDSDADLLRLTADLLYDRDDPRAMPWPEAAVLGRIRSRLRGLADAAENNPDGWL